MPFWDALADLQRVYGESEGQQVHRHLQAIVAWRGAARSLVDRYWRVAQTLRAGLVEVACQSDLMTDAEVIQQFFRRRPASSPETRTSIENNQGKPHKAVHRYHSCRSNTHGTSYIFLPWLIIIYGGRIDEASLHLLEELIEPICCLLLIFFSPFTHLIKCLDAGDIWESYRCWCCDRLGSLLDDLKLLGSHGVLYS